jgi:hypothetical protein
MCPVTFSWNDLFRTTILQKLGQGARLRLYIINASRADAMHIIEEVKVRPERYDEYDVHIPLHGKDAALFYMDNACTPNGHRAYAIAATSAQSRVIVRCEPLTLERYELYVRNAFRYMRGNPVLYLVEADGTVTANVARHDVDFGPESGPLEKWVDILRPPRARARESFQRHACRYL